MSLPLLSVFSFSLQLSAEYNDICLLENVKGCNMSSRMQRTPPHQSQIPQLQQQTRVVSSSAKTASWIKSSLNAGNVINSYARCDGPGFSDAYDQLIVSGTGKFECATGYVVGNDGESDTITFDIALCKRSIGLLVS
jgi:hypothetical protein